MKLYAAPRRSWIRVLPMEGTRVPPAASKILDGEVIFFDHLDGMYSFCRKPSGEVCHLVAWQEVEAAEEPTR